VAFAQDVLDLDKLARAVAIAETSNCKYAVVNNCHGIMTWVGGERRLKRYASKADSFADFKLLWKRAYQRFPTKTEAVRYTGNDNAARWLAIVTTSYHK